MLQSSLCNPCEQRVILTFSHPQMATKVASDVQNLPICCSFVVFLYQTVC